jgi:hypothetical protein
LIPLKNERKEVTGLLWIVHDLRNEYQLRKEQEKAEQIINNIDQIYFEIDSVEFLNTSTGRQRFSGTGKERTDRP